MTPPTADLLGLRALPLHGAQLVEVRPRPEFQELHLPGAIDVPLKELDAKRAEAAITQSRTAGFRLLPHVLALGAGRAGMPRRGRRARSRSRAGVSALIDHSPTPIPRSGTSFYWSGALEGQALQLLEAGPKLTEFPQLAQAFSEHLEQTREHQRLIDERLEQLDSHPARLQAGALRVGALNLGGFFKAQPATPIKLAGFAYAFEALEVGAYELLSRTAIRAGDEQTTALAQRILAEEQAAADTIAGTWDAAVDFTLEKQLA